MRRLDVIGGHIAQSAALGTVDAGVPMPKGLQDVLAAIRAKKRFNARAWITDKAKKLNDYLLKSGLRACVVSVSGGIDSAVTYALMLEAAKLPGSPLKRTLGIAQPIHSTSAVWKRAYELRTLGGEIITVDQTRLYDQLVGLVQGAMQPPLKDSVFANGQLRSYMRTPVNFYVAQLLSANGFPCIVLGTGNYDEDGYLRYFCKAGDGTVDVQLIADLHKSEVFAVARELGVPQSILVAPPTADLWEGQTDEDEMGFPYDFVEIYTTFLRYSADEQRRFLAALDGPSRAYFDTNSVKAKGIHDRNAHKASWPLNL